MKQADTPRHVRAGYVAGFELHVLSALSAAMFAKPQLAHSKCAQTSRTANHSCTAFM
jgi:hypothetical protein